MSGWEANFLLDPEMGGRTPMPVPMQEQQKMIADYWEQDSGWKWEDFANPIPEEVRAQIEAYQVYPNTAIHDKPFWGGTGSGIFSIKSAIDLIQGDTIPVRQDIWSIICRSKAPQ